jgi:hypothetical protein
MSNSVWNLQSAATPKICQEVENKCLRGENGKFASWALRNCLKSIKIVNVLINLNVYQIWYEIVKNYNSGKITLEKQRKD